MPSYKDLLPSKYLKQSDIPSPRPVTLDRIQVEDVSIPGRGSKKERAVAYFREYQKGMVLNTTNLRRMATITKSEDYDTWAGKQFTIYVDPDVEFGGELVGGLRLGAPKKAEDDPLGGALG